MNPKTFGELLDAGQRMLDHAMPVAQCGPKATGEATRNVVEQLRVAVHIMDVMKAWGGQEAVLRKRAMELIARFEDRAFQLQRRRMS
jgi:hypothetical protein